MFIKSTDWSIILKNLKQGKWHVGHSWTQDECGSNILRPVCLNVWAKIYDTFKLQVYWFLIFLSWTSTTNRTNIRKMIRPIETREPTLQVYVHCRKSCSGYGFVKCCTPNPLVHRHVLSWALPRFSWTLFIVLQRMPVEPSSRHHVNIVEV